MNEIATELHTIRQRVIEEARGLQHTSWAGKPVSDTLEDCRGFPGCRLCRLRRIQQELEHVAVLCEEAAGLDERAAA